MIKCVDQGLSYDSIGKRFNIGMTTIKDIVNRRKKIEEAVAKNKYFGLSRKVLKEGKKPEVEDQLYSYIIQKTEQGQAITNKDLMEVAGELNLKIHNENWTPSKGWLGKFKARYSLVSKKFIDSKNDIDISLIIEDKNSIVAHEMNETESVPNKISKVSVLSAADVLLDFVNEHDFPLKEVITLRIIRDRISEMAEAQTMYEVLQQDQEEDEDDSNEIVLKCDEEPDTKIESF